MKNLCLTSIFCIYASMVSVCAAEQTPTDICAQFVYHPRLNLTTSYGKLRYIDKYDQKTLTELSKKYGLTEEGMFASGLSLVGVDWSVALNTVSRVAEDDTICILPTSLDVHIGYRNPTIYMDKNIIKGSCQYNLTLRHEHHHQQISVATLEHFLPLFYKNIESKLKSVPPRHVTSLSQSNEASDEMNEEYIALIAPMVNQFKATLRHEHQKLDKRENYEYESQICPHYQENIKQKYKIK